MLFHKSDTLFCKEYRNQNKLSLETKELKNVTVTKYENWFTTRLKLYDLGTTKKLLVFMSGFLKLKHSKKIYNDF